MPIIESIEVAAVAVPLDVVTSFATRTVSERHYGLVRVRSSDGHEGIGFCYVGSAAGDLVRGLNQISISQAEGALAATDIHNSLRRG